MNETEDPRPNGPELGENAGDHAGHRAVHDPENNAEHNAGKDAGPTAETSGEIDPIAPLMRRFGVVLVGLVLCGLALAFTALAVLGITQMRNGGHGVWFGVGLILLTALGVWATLTLLRNGFQLQRISARAIAEGFELDTSHCERRPSGRLTSASATALFDEVAAEYEAAPQDWRVLYRLARAYDYAGDRGRGRDFMKLALVGEAAERRDRIADRK